jgi:hypothetical protein
MCSFHHHQAFQSASEASSDILIFIGVVLIFVLIINRGIIALDLTS